MKPNIPKQFRYVGSWHEENPKRKWFDHYIKKHKGKKPINQKGKEGR